MMPSVFGGHTTTLNSIFRLNHKYSLSGGHITRARQMLTPFILRRLKENVRLCQVHCVITAEHHVKVLTSLPAKTERIEWCYMTSSQAALYTTQSSSKCNVEMQQRKAASHPLLFRRLFCDTTVQTMAKVCIDNGEILRGEIYNDAFKELAQKNDSLLQQLCLEYTASAIVLSSRQTTELTIFSSV